MGVTSATKLPLNMECLAMGKHRCYWGGDLARKREVAGTDKSTRPNVIGCKMRRPVKSDPMSSTPSSVIKQLIVINAIGSDRTGLVYDLTRVVTDCGGNIVESRMSALGMDFAMLLLVSGHWHTLAKLEGELKKPELFYLLQKKQFNFKRLIKLREDFLPEMRRDADEIRRGRSKN